MVAVIKEKTTASMFLARLELSDVQEKWWLLFRILKAGLNILSRSWKQALWKTRTRLNVLSARALLSFLLLKAAGCLFEVSRWVRQAAAFSPQPESSRMEKDDKLKAPYAFAKR